MIGFERYSSRGTQTPSENSTGAAAWGGAGTPLQRNWERRAWKRHSCPIGRAGGQPRDGPKGTERGR